jgi:amidase
MGRDVHETLFQSATDAAQALSRKELSSRELTGMLLTRIESVNPALNAVVELRREAALQEAVAADQATARGDDAGPLHGVPMTIKDSFNVAELHTTWGNPAFKDFVAGSDATVVQRLRQAGAIIVGKTTWPSCWPISGRQPTSSTASPTIRGTWRARRAALPVERPQHYLLG